MSLAAGPFLIAATLLALGGLLKTARPDDTTNALHALGLPVAPLLVRVGGGAEAAVGLAALATGDRIAATLLAVSYAAFAAFVLIALGRGTPLASCGCFGKEDTPPTRLHVVLNAGAAAAGLAVALNPGAGLVDVVGSQPLAGVPFVLLLGCGVSFAYLALTSLPRLLQLVHASGGPA
jgi:methylamine utilization protein MauE